MENMKDHWDEAWYWVQGKAMDRRYELEAGEQVLASLSFKSAWGSLATAESSGGVWTFKRVGFFTPRVTARRAGEEAEQAVYRPKWTGREGELTLAGGRRYHWRVANFWATRFQLEDEAGECLLSYEKGSPKKGFSELFKIQAQVGVSAQGQALPELELLVLMSWYLIILQQEDAAAVAAATAATS